MTLRSARLARGAFVGLLGLVVACVSSEPLTCGADAVRVGVLLPLTGNQAATGANVERALIWATEQINATLAPTSPRFCLTAADTGSDVAIGKAAGRALIEDQHVVAIIGPEEAEVAQDLLPRLAASETVALSGSMALAETDAYAQSQGYFFRLAPTNRSLSAILAMRMVADDVKRSAIVFADDAYGHAFADSMGARLMALGTPHVAAKVLDPRAEWIANTLASLGAQKPDGIVLVAPARLAAQFVESLRLSGTTKLFLAPTLKQEAFIANVAPDALNGSVGVAPAVSSDGNLFDRGFAARFDGDAPFLAAYYYFDALALYALAFQAAAHDAGNGLPSRRAVRDKIQEVASSSLGLRVAWYELDNGTRLLRAGQPINYRGISGGVDINDRGEVGESLVRTFTIVDNRIVDDAVVVAKTP